MADGDPQETDVKPEQPLVGEAAEVRSVAADGAVTTTEAAVEPAEPLPLLEGDPTPEASQSDASATDKKPEAAEQKPRVPAGRSMTRKGREGRRGSLPPPPPPKNRKMLSIEDAAAWFVSDLMEVSGFVRVNSKHRSGYSHYRPILTKPDPWYFAGLVALEGCKIVDLFPQTKSDALLREVLAQADAAGAAHDVRVSSVVLGVMGRLGMGQLLLHGKVPDFLIAKIMRILLGSPKTSARLLPTKDAHEQVTSALRIGNPVWWRMFVRRFDVRLGNEPVRQPKLLPLAPAIPEESQADQTLDAPAPKPESVSLREDSASDNPNESENSDEPLKDAPSIPSPGGGDASQLDVR